MRTFDLKKALSIVLTITLLCSCIGCNKKNTRARVVLESDPYFSCEEIPLEIEFQEDQGKELNYRWFRHIKVFKDCVLVSVEEQYVIPEELQKEQDEFFLEYYLHSQEEADELQERIDSYSRKGIAILGMDGKTKGFADIPSGAEIVGITEDSFGNPKVLLSLFAGSGYLAEVCDVSPEGELVNNVRVDYNFSYIESNILFLDNGNFFCYENAYDNSSVLLFNSEGKLLSSEAILDPINKLFAQPIDKLFQIDGKVYACCVKQSLYDYTVMPETYLYEIDNDSGKMIGEPIKSTCPIHISKLVQGQDGVYAFLGNGIEKVDLLDGENSSIVLSWNETDCNYINESITDPGFRYESSNDIYFTREVYTSQTNFYLIHLKREDKNPHAGKKILYLAYLENIRNDSGNLSNEFVEYLNAYNLDPERQMRILVADYSGESNLASSMYGAICPSSEELSLIADQVYIDILSGDGPDILLNFGSFSQFDTNRVLVDLNTFIDGNNPIDRTNFFDNVFRAYERNGKLYQLPLNFAVTGMVANKDYVGERTGWTFDEAKEISQLLPDNCTLFGNISQSDMLQTLMSAEMNHFLDYDNREVMFDNPELKGILELTKDYGIPKTSAEIWWEITNSEEPISNESLFESGAIVAMNTTVSSLEEFGVINYYCNENVCLIGTPNINGSGAKADGASSVAITKSCPYAEEAWDFLRYLLEDDIQLSLANSDSNFPVNRNAFESQMNQKIEENSDSSSLLYMTNFTAHLDEELATDLQKVIESISEYCATDPSVMMIIEEEIQGYLAEQKTVDEVAAVIQRRSAVVVEERG